MKQVLRASGVLHEANTAISPSQLSMAPPSNVMKTREKAVFVAQQLHFANTLAGNDPIHRARAMKKLRKYFLARANGNFCFSHEDFMRIWKGLFYCMWMSDKPLIQEELAEEISQLVHCFQYIDMAFTFVQAFFDTLIVEWFGIDYHRMDKFQMFVRRFLRQSLMYCKNKNWQSNAVTRLCDVFESTVLSSTKCINECADISLIMHFSDIFVEELAKVGGGKLPKERMLEFLKPFMTILAEVDDFRLRNMIRDKVFYCLIKQSPEGMEYEEKFEAWKRAGFPGKSWKEMVFVGKDDRRTGVKIKDLDPRAGKVNVYLPHLQFDAQSVAKTLKAYAIKSCNTRSRKSLLKIGRKFLELSEGRYPLQMNLPRSLLDPNKYRFTKTTIDNAVEDLFSFNENLEKEARKLENHGKRKKKSVKLQKSKKIKLENSSAKEEDGNENCEKLDGLKLYDNQETEEETNCCSSSAAVSDEIEESGTSTIWNEILTLHGNDAKNETSDNESQMDCEESENQVNNSHSTNITKRKKIQSVSSWRISESPNLQRETTETREVCKEDEYGNLPKVCKEDEHGNLPEVWNEVTDIETEFATASEETHLQDGLQQDTDLDEIIQKKNEEKSEIPKEEIMKDLPDSENQFSVQNNKDSVSLEKNTREGDLISEELDSIANDEVSTPLRRSTRRRSNLIQRSMEENVKEEEVSITSQTPSTPLRSSARLRSSQIYVNSAVKEETEKIPIMLSNNTTAESTKKTLLRSATKRRLIKASTLSEGLLEGEGNEEGSVLKCEDETPLPKRRSWTPRGMIRAKGRITTVPDREIPNVQETSELPTTSDVIVTRASDNCENSPINNTSDEVSNDNETLNEQNDSLSTPQRRLRTPGKLSPGKKRVSLRTTPASIKKVNIVLQMNKSQAVSEYVAAVKQSPSVPHDANKMPCKGVLKRTSVLSPINPFYVPPKGLK